MKLHKEKAVCLVDCAGILSTQELNSGQCDKCGYKPSQISDLRRHKLRDSCDELFSHNCGHCERQFLKKSKLKTHQKSAVCLVDSAGILSTQELSSGKGDKCGHKPSQISDLRRHKKKLLCKGLLQKNEQQRERLPVKNKQQLRKEILSTTELSSGKCDKCGLKPVSNSNLRKHK